MTRLTMVHPHTPTNIQLCGLLNSVIFKTNFVLKKNYFVFKKTFFLIFLEFVFKNSHVLGCFNYVKKSFWIFLENFGISWNLSFLIVNTSKNDKFQEIPEKKSNFEKNPLT